MMGTFLPPHNGGMGTFLPPHSGGTGTHLDLSRSHVYVGEETSPSHQNTVVQ